MLKGFRDFIARGNVIDLAVAVVIGAAFTAIVDVVVAQLIDPLISLFFQADSLDTALMIPVGSTHIGLGAIIGALINFLAVAAVVYFVFVLPMNKYKERIDAKNKVEPEEELPSEQQLLVQIRDLLQKNESAQ
ncbi:large conductance mechanosensitive channel protein MscL [Microbacterium sp. YY-01]|uniref:large conductance mechanosensitive channel protein MscL n=1 Tax=Microbacterium sp. YY-01 TaxID=3421634 RepID=UPI003D168B5F